MKAFVLFGKLTKVVGISKKHFFKGEVKGDPASLHLPFEEDRKSVV